MNAEPLRAEADVLVIGSGAAGMYAAIEAARAGCTVLLADRSLIGRGGATVMAQMAVAAALGESGQALQLLRFDQPAAMRGILGIGAPLRNLLVRRRVGARGRCECQDQDQRSKQRAGERGTQPHPIRPDVGELGLAA